jgi:RND superfamily putative drug exporter
VGPARTTAQTSNHYAAKVLERWTRTVIKRRILVISCWVVVIIVGAFAGARLPELLTTSLTVPGTGSANANTILINNFHNNVEGTFTVVIPLHDTSNSAVSALERDLARAATSVPTATVSQERAVGGVLYANINTSMNLAHAANATETLRHALHDDGLSDALVTGPPALQHDITPVLTSDLHRGEFLAVGLALLLLLAVLGFCWAIFIPYIVAGATTAGTLSIVYLLAHRFLMVLYVPNVIELIGLALAIDYSLLIVHRFRFEVGREGGTVDDAIVRTMSSAGRTVVLSGFAVAIGLATLLIVPVPFVRSLGAAGLVVPILSLLSALTLQPALLSIIGRKGVHPVGIRGLMARRDFSTGTWARIARGVIHRPLVVLLGTLVVLFAATFSVFWLQLTPGSVTAVPQQIEAAHALTLVSNKVGPGVITPIQIVLDTGRAGGDTTKASSLGRLDLAEAILKTPNVFVVAIGHTKPFEDSSRRYEQILVVSGESFGSAVSQNLVRVIRHDVIPGVKLPAGTQVYVGGAPAQGVDFLNSVYGSFPWIVLLALLLAYGVLLRAFRSLVLPLIAALLDLISVGVAYGFLVLVFRFGVGSSILGTYHVSQIEGWVPVFLFAMLFGLSMDYEVFIVSRIREARLNGASNDEAIVEGLSNTGGVVTSAALIMVVALSGLVFGHVAGLQELGVGLALGVLVDATIIRGLLLPSIMSLLGRWNWWLPKSVARLLRTTASPLESREGRR